MLYSILITNSQFTSVMNKYSKLVKYTPGGSGWIMGVG